MSSDESEEEDAPVAAKSAFVLEVCHVVIVIVVVGEGVVKFV